MNRVDPGLLRLVDRCLLVSFRGRHPDPTLVARLTDGLAGVILFAENVGAGGEVAGLLSQLRSAAGDRMLVAIDEEGGEVTRLEATTGSAYPTAWALGTADDPALTRSVAGAVAADLAAVGINLTSHRSPTSTATPTTR